MDFIFISTAPGPCLFIWYFFHRCVAGWFYCVIGIQSFSRWGCRWTILPLAPICAKKITHPHCLIGGIRGTVQMARFTIYRLTGREKSPLIAHLRTWVKEYAYRCPEQKNETTIILMSFKRIFCALSHVSSGGSTGTRTRPQVTGALFADDRRSKLWSSETFQTLVSPS